MAKKRAISKRKRKPYRHRGSSKQTGRNGLQTAEKLIITYLFENDGPTTMDAMMACLADSPLDKKKTRSIIANMLDRGILAQINKKKYRLVNKGRFYRGVIEKNPRGFGFVTELSPQGPAQALKKDPFLSIKRIGSANHGDTVLIHITNVRQDGRPEAELITVLERFRQCLTGFYRQGPPPKVLPEDPRYPSTIRITGPFEEDIPDNHVVLVEITPEENQGNQVFGKIVEVIGPFDDIDVQMRMVIEKHSLPRSFTEEVTREAESLDFDQSDYIDRSDLRDIVHVTIDGATAKDFDDAIAVERTADGYRLYVSIADVAHFVQPDSELDREAYRRGTSIYFPDRVIPMLPERLSNHLCSLVPHEDRLTFTAILDFSSTGKLNTHKFCKSVIRSRQRFTYGTVNQLLSKENQSLRQEYNDFLPLLDTAGELAGLLLSHRLQRGSIGFNIPEPEIVLQEDGRISTIRRKSRYFAHQIIEEFMLAANEAVAATFTARRLEFLYRIHEEPDTSKVAEFKEFAKIMSIPLPKKETGPRWFARIVENVKGSPMEYVVNNLLLRTMQQARYSAENCGHFGLAATDYTHFTSPIRRYPDLLVHRFLAGLIKKEDTRSSRDTISLTEKANHLSTRERLAITAERDMADRLKMFFMEQFIGKSFSAVISGIHEGVIFIELLDLFVSGAIDVYALEDDYYLHDPKRYRYIGEISGKTYQLGAPVEVTLVDVEYRRRRINFIPSQ